MCQFQLNNNFITELMLFWFRQKTDRKPLVWPYIKLGSMLSSVTQVWLRYRFSPFVYSKPWFANISQYNTWFLQLNPAFFSISKSFIEQMCYHVLFAFRYRIFVRIFLIYMANCKRETRKISRCVGGYVFCSFII